MNRLSGRSLLLLLAPVQFTHVVDFMILMPLGPQLMRELHIGPGHFSALVAAYHQFGRGGSAGRAVYRSF